MLTACCHCNEDNDDNGISISIVSVTSNTASTHAITPKPPLKSSTCRSLLSLPTSKSHNSLRKHIRLSKHSKLQDVQTRHSQRKSQETFESSQLLKSKSTMIKDQIIRQLEIQNEQFQRVIQKELKPLKMRFTVLKQDYINKISMLDQLEKRIVTIELQKNKQNQIDY